MLLAVSLATRGLWTACSLKTHRRAHLWPLMWTSYCISPSLPPTIWTVSEHTLPLGCAGASRGRDEGKMLTCTVVCLWNSAECVFVACLLKFRPHLIPEILMRSMRFISVQDKQQAQTAPLSFTLTHTWGLWVHFLPWH